jgi:hypothetical protein
LDVSATLVVEVDVAPGDKGGAHVHVAVKGYVFV